MKSLVICEKPNQAKALRAALGSRFGEILPAQGHILTLKEPDEINPEWAGDWKPVLMWPGKFYPKKVSKDTKSFFDAIKSSAGKADQIIIATDCDREGQLIGDEIVDFIGFKGRVLRAIFNAEDPKSLRDAFSKLHPNEKFRGVYMAGQAREQADQTVNLSLTRTASCILKAPGSKGAIGIGRVKTPVLAIVCAREDEIQNFKPQDYFLVDAQTRIESGSLTLTCANLPASLIKEQEGASSDENSEELDENDAALEEMEPLRGKIMRRDLADALAAAVKGFEAPLKVKSERKKQGPPKLFDLTALQSTASARFSWSGEKTLAVAQKLYSERTIITYPRGEARYLPEQNAQDVPTLVRSLTALRGLSEHAGLLSKPEIRRGKSGHFCDAALQGVSHYAIIPNINEAGSFGRVVPTLDPDEARLFDLISRQYLAALAPDHEYRQTTADLDFPWKNHVWGFRASGRVPLVPGWKAILGQASKKDGEEDDLPAMKNGESAKVLEARIRSVTTKPPARYTEGALIRVMQEAWRLVPPGEMRERLRDAKGIGTPATRGDVLKSLKKQGQITEKGKSILPTEGGMKLWRTLKEVCPNVVDPARTAIWETLFDKVEKGDATAEAVVKHILVGAQKEIDAIVARKGSVSVSIGKTSKPTDKMLSLAKSIAERKGIKLPKGATTDGAVCKAFLDEHVVKRPEGETGAPGGYPPSEKQIAFARSIAERMGSPVPEDALKDSKALSAWIDKAKSKAPAPPPSEKQVSFAKMLAERAGVDLPEEVMKNMAECSKFIDKLKAKAA